MCFSEISEVTVGTVEKNDSSHKTARRILFLSSRHPVPWFRMTVVCWAEGAVQLQSICLTALPSTTKGKIELIRSNQRRP